MVHYKKELSYVPKLHIFLIFGGGKVLEEKKFEKFFWPPKIFGVQKNFLGVKKIFQNFFLQNLTPTENQKNM